MKNESPAIWAAMPVVRSVVLSATRFGGIHIRDLCQYAGISIDDLYRDDAVANLSQSSKLWEYCLDKDDLSLALRVAHGSSLLTMGTFGLLFHSSPDALTALEASAPLTNSVTTTNFANVEIQGETVIYRVGLAEAWEQFSPQTSLWNLAYSCATLLRTLELATGQILRPQEMRFRYKRPPGNIDFRSYLRVDPSFDHPFSCIIWHKKDLQVPILSHNSTLFEMAKTALEQSLEQQKGTAAFTYEVRRVILKHFGMLRPRLEDVADLLHIAPRSLQRRLQEEGTSFQAIVDAVKSELAVGMLKKGDVSVNEVAYQLGYDDPGVFRRAFKKWTGLNPKAYRLAS